MAKIRKEENLETPVSSMIDVVFLLIIFFVVTAAVDEEVVDLNIKLAQAENVNAVERKEPRTVTINVKEDGTFNIATVPLVKQQLTDLLVKTRKDYGDRFPVLIRGDANTNFLYIDRVMDTIGKAQLYRIRFAAESTKQ